MRKFNKEQSRFLHSVYRYSENLSTQTQQRPLCAPIPEGVMHHVKRMLQIGAYNNFSGSRDMLTINFVIMWWKNYKKAYNVPKMNTSGYYQYGNVGIKLKTTTGNSICFRWNFFKY